MLFRQLRYSLPWASVGNRMTCWFSKFSYTYSKTRHLPTNDMPTPLLQILDLANTYFNRSFNSVLCNLYMTGNNSIGWHSDNEPELGDKPFILSLSLGATRCFSFRSSVSHAIKHHIELSSGSAVVMSGKTQSLWEHAVLPSASLSARINITLREIGT